MFGKGIQQTLTPLYKDIRIIIHIRRYECSLFLLLKYIVRYKAIVIPILYCLTFIFKIFLYILTFKNDKNKFIN